jgi:predicted HAD superfamily Cof-like phosphohydrolase
MSEESVSIVDPATIDLLSGTEIFMREARQLEQAEFPIMPGGSEHPLRELRRKLLAEEYHEYDRGEDDENLVEVVDGLLDVVVIAWGSLLAYVGPDIAKACAAEVVRSNLSKVIGPGLPMFRDDGKVIKPADFTPPNIRGILEEAGLV